MYTEVLQEQSMYSKDQKRLISDSLPSLFCANQVLSLKDAPNEILVWDCIGQVFKFNIDADYGAGANQAISGILTERPALVSPEKKSLDDQIFICEASRLRLASYDTLR